MGDDNLEVAKIILETANSKLHVDEIAQRAISDGLVQGSTPDALSKIAAMYWQKHRSRHSSARRCASAFLWACRPLSDCSE